MGMPPLRSAQCGKRCLLKIWFRLLPRWGRSRFRILNGEYALQWNGNWAALPILEAFDDALSLPVPDGLGLKSAQRLGNLAFLLHRKTNIQGPFLMGLA